MDCFPNPEFTHISPDADSLNLRKHLRFVYYGEIFIFFVDFIVISVLSALFQLITIWIAFCSWATMSYCQVLIQLIFNSFNMVVILLSWRGFIAQA